VPAMRVEHDLLLNMEKLMSKCDTVTPGTNYSPVYRVQREACGLQFMCISILVRTHTEGTGQQEVCQLKATIDRHVKDGCKLDSGSC
jgi:hypothetical protein